MRRVRRRRRPLLSARPMLTRLGGASSDAILCNMSRTVLSSMLWDLPSGRAAWLDSVRLQSGSQPGDGLGRLALDRADRAAQQLSRLLHAEVAIETEHDRGPLPRRQTRKRCAHVQLGVAVMSQRRRIRQCEADPHPLGPGRALLAEELADEDRLGVGLDVL